MSETENERARERERERGRERERQREREREFEDIPIETVQNKTKIKKRMDRRTISELRDII
jgi:hypothetical protein